MISFVYDGHGSRKTPARFRVTPRYAFLEGGSPYAILVRLSDIVEILPEEERKMHTQYGTQTKRHEIFTLYTLSFYEKAKSSKKQLPEQAMGFFSREIRDRAWELVMRQRKENEGALHMKDETKREPFVL